MNKTAKSKPKDLEKNFETSVSLLPNMGELSKKDNKKRRRMCLCVLCPLCIIASLAVLSLVLLFAEAAYPLRSMIADELGIPMPDYVPPATLRK